MNFSKENVSLKDQVRFVVIVTKCRFVGDRARDLRAKSRYSAAPPCALSTTSSKSAMPSDERQDKQANAAQARQVIDVFHEISTLLVLSFLYLS